MKRIKWFFFLSLFVFTNPGIAQGDNEIQVYASPTIQKGWTIFELHSNYAFKGSKFLTNPKDANWLNETLEITHGFGSNFELGFYTFSAFDPGGKFQYLGNQLRPRVSWTGGKFGISLSAEFGFYRPDEKSSFIWQGEIRPIIDRSINAWYFSINPNFDFVVTGEGKGIGFSPQIKIVHTFNKKFGFGIEYYGGLGNIDSFLPLDMQEHLIGPMFDLYTHPMWELNGGMLFGVTPNSNQSIFKLLLGRRVGK